MIEIDGLYKYLSADGDVESLVSGRIYPVKLPKGGSLPAIVYFQSNGESIESMDGDNPTEIKRFQFSCFARDSAVAKTLRRAVRSRLVPKSDSSGTTATVAYDLPDGTHIQSARMHMELDLPYEEGSGETIQHSMIEIEFVYENPS